MAPISTDDLLSVQFSTVAQSCLTLCNPVDCSTLGFPVLHRLLAAAAAAAKSLQWCPTLCDPIDGSPPGSPIPGILQVRTLECKELLLLLLSRFSGVRLCATP